MSGLLNAEREKHMSVLRDHLYRNGPCTVLEAAEATGLRPGQVSSMIADGSLTAVGSSPIHERCSICREAANVGDLCSRCREDLQVSQGLKPAEPVQKATRPDRPSGSGTSGSGMRSRR